MVVLTTYHRSSSCISIPSRFEFSPTLPPTFSFPTFPLAFTQQVLLSTRLVNIQHPNSAGDSPLHMSARLGLPIITAFLMLHQADPSALNAQSRTPVDVATAHRHVATASVLSSSPAEIFSLAQQIGSGRRSNAGSPQRDGERTLSLDALGDVLQSIWTSTHHIRNVVAHCRTVPFPPT